jgi:hypothetical protein
MKHSHRRYTLKEIWKIFFTHGGKEACILLVCEALILIAEVCTGFQPTWWLNAFVMEKFVTKLRGSNDIPDIET